MISKELIEKAKKCTNKEELLGFAKENNVEINDENITSFLNSVSENRELSDQELENVAGGCTSHSSETYASLGFEPAYEHHQEDNYHPVITTLFNHCSLAPFCRDCAGCVYITQGWTHYCLARSEERDDA